MMQYQTQRRAPIPAPPAHAPEATGPSLQALRAGAAPTAEQLGRPVDLPGAIRAKMEASFGADLSGVRLYESQAVADAGAEAVAMGGHISFAPGKLDFSSGGGQALLGHELSHVVSQARGEVTGSGFLNDRALEARADREGAMAAAGESVYSGPVTPISASSTAQAAGPMQAKKPLDKLREHQEKKAQAKYVKEIENTEISGPKLQSQSHIAEEDAEGNYLKGRFVLKHPNKKTEDYSAYNSPQGAALGLLMQSMSDEELTEHPHFQEEFLKQYTKDTKARLNSPNGGKHSLTLGINAEQNDYDRLLRASTTEDMVTHAGITNSDLAGKALDRVGDDIQQNDKLKALLRGGADAMLDAVGGDQEQAKAGILERFATQGLVPALSKRDKEIRRRLAEREAGPSATEADIDKEAEGMGRLNVGTLGSNILDRYKHAEAGAQALKLGNSRVMVGKRPINAAVFQDGERFKRSLD